VPTFREMLAEAKAAVREIDPAQAEQELTADKAVVLDVREPDEYEQGALAGAVHIPRGTLETSVEGRIPDKSSHLVIYCAAGVRSAFAAKTLQELGYTDVASVIGGFNRWKDEGREWSTPESLTSEQRNRYQRHLLLPEVGEAGQLKLLDSKVLLLGAGGLGSPAALYLAAAGVGTLGIIDMDVVDASNLQRQILHNTDRIGERKVDSAKKTLTLMNPDVNVVTHDVRLGADNILDIIDGYDVIVDGTDNFPTRYLVNDASLLKSIPVVHGSIFRFEGQVTVFNPWVGPCYRCMIPEPPPSRPGRDPPGKAVGLRRPRAELSDLQGPSRSRVPDLRSQCRRDHHRRVRRAVHAPCGGTGRDVVGDPTQFHRCSAGGRRWGESRRRALVASGPRVAVGTPTERGPVNLGSRNS